jgi:hypothetical protein
MNNVQPSMMKLTTSFHCRKQVPGSPKKNDASPTSPERPIPIPPQNGDDGSDDIDVTYVSVVNPEPPKRMPRPTPIPLPRKGFISKTFF